MITLEKHNGITVIRNEVTKQRKYDKPRITTKTRLMTQEEKIINVDELYKQATR